ncbi:MAG: hypothetical protein NZ902_00070 [Acidilobaceae archaeon]|nr:hypothetical protein [Acidilobaceae archaeon]MDW7973662.1 hypothetical protein [Sulfolobales archaeon]
MRLASLFSRVSLHWGFVVRLPGATAAQPALPIPPVTTVVGAFSAPLFRLLGVPFGNPSIIKGGRAILSEHFECSLRSTLAAAAGLSGEGGLVMYQELTKIATSPYKGGKDWWDKVKMKIGTPGFYNNFIPTAQAVQAVGASYGPGTRLDLAWVLDVDELADCLAKRGVKASRADVEAALALAAHGVSRLGSKEGIASVMEGKYIDKIEIIYKGSIKTRFYVPERCVEPLSEEVGKAQLWDTSYQPATYYAPGVLSKTLWVSSSPLEYRLLDDMGCAAYKLVSEKRIGESKKRIILGIVVGEKPREK